MIDKLEKLMFFVVGWISGGGILAFVNMWLVMSLAGDNFNTWFVAGCMWGTFGTGTGLWMMRVFNARWTSRETP